MRTKLVFALVCLLLLGTASRAQEEKKEKKVMSNADILLMTKNQFDDDTLIKLIQASDTNFDTSGEALIDLKNQGVSSAVLRAMLQAAQHKRRVAEEAAAPASPSTSAPPPDSNSPSPSNSTASPSPAPSADRSSAPSSTMSAPPAVASSSPPFVTNGASQNSSGMSINPQQMAGMQNPMAMMSMMGTGGMGGFGSPVEYTAEQLPHVFLF